MKLNFTLYVLIPVMMVLTLFACKENEIPTLEGKWRIKIMTEENCPNPSDNVILMANTNEKFCGTAGGINYCSTYDFRFTKSTYTYTKTTERNLGGMLQTEIETTIGAYTADRNQVTFCVTGETTCETATFYILGEILTITEIREGECDSIMTGEKQ